MVAIQSILLAATCATTALAAPSDISKRQGSGETITTSQTGTTGDYFYTHWAENDAGASMTLNGNSYTLDWTEQSGNIVSGIGWSTGSARDVSYEGNVQSSGNWYLTLYGWTRNPLIEFYVVESYGTYNPGSGGQEKGTFESDGSSYTIYEATRNNKPSIDGTATFQQFFSVRQNQRTSGTITFQNHIDAWAAQGMNLGSSFDYQVLATEGYQSSGSSTVTITS